MARMTMRTTNTVYMFTIFYFYYLLSISPRNESGLQSNGFFLDISNLTAL